MSIGINLFHIIFISILLISLTINLKDGNDKLKYIAYATTGFMILRHAFIIKQKL
jgi:hypothetical protein